MQLRVGGKYRTRDGKWEVVITKEQQPRSLYRFLGEAGSGCTWGFHANGAFATNPNDTCSHDLVSEILPELKLKPNTYYRTRDGRKAFVAGESPFPDTARFHRFAGFVDEIAVSWSSAGSECGVHETSLDLIAVWQEPVLVKLNDEHTAEVSDVVKVGCQTFPVEKIRELQHAYDQFRGAVDRFAP